ncbi:hypothetical protein [Anaeromyxobacter dehalogenans]|uniref:Uncharacterized protein n=1 Tax=Anaeromyxobacter dehalogenans (strain 2CP-C) TaxID=290397 RepID=Q2INE5_ANADE|nr:hypothetical protein [Anaeromyxobacter dehalogenans]ABC80330.1 hypothetical protein Adeh_0554 [Anaeromyxobacter dehalogenans 2CP-C]
MRRWIVGAIIALSTMTAASASDVAGEARHCSLVGSYVTGAEGVFSSWMVTMTGGEVSGTLTTNVPAWPVPLGAGVKLLPTVGVWKRTGTNTFAFTQIFWAVGPDGAVVAVFKNSGTDTLTDECNVLVVESTMEAFNPDGSEHPLGIPGNDTNANWLPPMIGYRVQVQPPADDAVPMP